MFVQPQDNYSFSLFLFVFAPPVWSTTYIVKSKMKHQSCVFRTAPPKRERCGVCQKKCGLVPLRCHCGGFYCSRHHNAEEHECLFDYRGHAQLELAAANPKITVSQLAEI